MLTKQQIRTFSETGWVLIENAFSAEQVEHWKRCLDRLHAAFASEWVHKGQVPVGRSRVDNLVLLEPTIRDLLVSPVIHDSNRQLLGTAMHYLESYSWLIEPHAERAERREALRDPDSWGWHRGFRPKWGIFPDDADADRVNCLFMRNIIYVTDVSPGDGGSAVLSGSHRLEGDYKSLKDQCEVVEVTAPAGSLLLFSETLLHSGVPIVSDRTRYAFFFGLSAPWVRANHDGFLIPDATLRSIRDEKLRNILGGQIGFTGQRSEMKE